MLMNFNLVKWRLASLKLILHQLEVLQEQNDRQADAIRMVFDKDLFNN
jgi:hypothetical protein